jgi:hypothetical protein
VIKKLLVVRETKKNFLEKNELGLAFAAHAWIIKGVFGWRS